MADKSLALWRAPIYGEEETEALTPSGLQVIKKLGVVTCRMSVARFLGIVEKGVAASYWKEYQASLKSLSLADGTTLEPSKGTAQTAKNAKKKAPGNDIGARGSRTVTIITGNKILNSKRKKGAKTAVHQISFRFPSWVNTFGISDWLGTIIDNTKFNVDPGTGQVKPYFKVQGGRTYAIMGRNQAVSESTDILAPITTAEVIALKAKIDAKYLAKFGS
jgi:hypothetical protein